MMSEITLKPCKYCGQPGESFYSPSGLLVYCNNDKCANYRQLLPVTHWQIASLEEMQKFIQHQHEEIIRLRKVIRTLHDELEDIIHDDF